MEQIAQTAQDALQAINCPPSDPKDMVKAEKMLANLRTLYEKRTGSAPDETVENGFIRMFAVLCARVRRGCKTLQLNELLSEETPPAKKAPPSAQPLKNKSSTTQNSPEIGLAAEEGTVTPKKTEPLPQDQNVPDNTGEYAVDLGEPGLAAEELTQAPPSTGSETEEDELDAFFKSANAGSSGSPRKRK